MNADKRSLKIAYLSSNNPLDKRAWSGTHFSIYSAIQKELGEVTVLGPYQPKNAFFFGKMMTAFFQLISGKRFNLII